MKDNREQRIQHCTIIGFVANMLLTVAKISAGIVGHSAAMLADGIHSMSDFISDIIVLVCIRLSSKGQDAHHHYGHGKYETFATLCISILLLVVGVELFLSGFHDIMALIHGESIPVPESIALWMALLSIITKEALYQYTIHVGRAVESPVVIANAWHHRTDAMSSIGSAIGIGCIIAFGTQWLFMDPLICCLISLFIIILSVKMAHPVINELLEESLPKDMEDEIISIVHAVDGVNGVHALKTRRNGPYIILEAHIVVDPHICVHEAHCISTMAERRLREHFGKDTQITIHIEPSDDAE